MLRGKICNLKNIKATDAKEILNWRTSKNVQKNFPSKVSKNLSKHLVWIRKIIKSKEDKYFIIKKKNDDNIGLCFLSNINYINRNAEFGYYLSNKKYYGQGFSMEAEYMIINYGFETLGLNKIYCENLENNKNILNVHKKFGFKLDGVKREEIFKNNKYIDIYLMSLLKKDYNRYKKKISGIFNSLYN